MKQSKSIIYNSLYDQALGNAPLLPEEELVCDTERYSDWECIGQGGMKKVYRVYDHKTRRFVALATLLAPDNKDLFLREAWLTAMLEHPGIITIYDIGIIEDGTPYFTMEMKNGKSLLDLVTSYPLSVTSTHEVKNPNNQQPITNNQKICPNNQQLITNNSRRDLIEIFLKICDAVSYAHSRNVLHLDLKPDNIQIGLFGEVQICDWGLGKVIGQNELVDATLDKSLYEQLTDVTVYGEVKGSPGYMAPEQIKGSEKDERTDIYALGALLYYLLTGRKTISGSYDKLLEKTISGDIKPPELCRDCSDVPAALSAVTMKALSVNPADRYQSVNELQREIHKYLSGFATEAEKAGFITQFTLFYRRNMLVNNIIAAALVIIISATVFFVNELNKSRLQAQESERHAKLSLKRAEDALRLYGSELEWNKIALEASSDSVFRYAYILTDNKIYTDPIQSLNNAIRVLDKFIAERPEYTMAHMQRGYARMILQQFDRACVDFAVNDETAEDLHMLCKKYSNRSTREGIQPADDIVEVVKVLGRDERPWRRVLAVKFMVADRKLRESVREHARIVAEVIKVSNPNWDTKNFQFKEGGILKLQGQLLKKLTVHVGLKKYHSDAPQMWFCLLHTLPLKTLDISGTSVSSLTELSGLAIHTLNISNTPINSLRGIEALPMLKTLVIGKEQISQEQLQLLPETIELQLVTGNKL